MASRSVESVGFPGDATNASRRLVSILLDRQQAYFTDRRNETTATARSMGGHAMAVTFWMAEPPDISVFSVSCSKPPNHMTADFKVLPHVVGAEGRFVLIRANFYSRYAKDEYFMYNAGDGEPPSLDWVPPPDDDNDGSMGRVKEFGIVLTDRRDHYLVAALCDAYHAPSDYQLRIYSSEMKAWSTKILSNPCPGLQKIIPEKVISLGEGILGWVDFSRGLVACDLRQDPPGVHFIPLPEPLPENRDKLKGSPPVAAARSVRDLACINGVLKFVEMEHRVVEKPIDPAEKDVLYDSDLIMSLKREEMDEKPISSYGWRAVTWSRTVWSNFWRKECTFGVDDFFVNESTPSSMSGLQGKAAGNLAFRHLYSAFPTLSTEGNDILYLKSVAEPSDRNGWVVALDLGNKTVKAHGCYSFKDSDPSKHAFHPCTLSCHLNWTPGIEVSACHEDAQTGSSANKPNNTSICVGRPIPQWKLTNKLRRPLDDKTNRAKIGAKGIQDDDISLPVPFPRNHVESMKKIQRVIMAEKIKRFRREDQGIGESDHVSRVCPIQVAPSSNLQCYGDYLLLGQQEPQAKQ